MHERPTTLDRGHHRHRDQQVRRDGRSGGKATVHEDDNEEQVLQGTRSGCREGSPEGTVAHRGEEGEEGSAPGGSAGLGGSPVGALAR